MIRRAFTMLFCACLLSIAFAGGKAHCQEQAYGRVWGGQYNLRDWERFYHYPYVYYPQNFWGSEYYRSSDSLYYRYPPEMRIPVPNKKWQNFYHEKRRYHWGHHFILDIF